MAFLFSRTLLSKGLSVSLRHAALATLVVALSACGGGGSGGGSSFSSQSSSVDNYSSSSSSSSSVADSLPDSFGFGESAVVAPNEVVESPTVTISGIADSVTLPVAVSGGEVSVDGGAFTATPGDVSVDQTLQVRTTAPSAHSSDKEVQVTVGEVSAVFSIRTADDTSPEGFSFAPVEDAEPDSEQTSDTVTINGISVPVPISVSGGEYAINGREFTSDAGAISAGQTLRLRGMASAELETRTAVTVTVGTGEEAVVEQFAITTLTDTTAPEVTITFPLPNTAFDPAFETNTDGLTVRGTVEDDYSRITSIKVFLDGVEHATIDTDELPDWVVTLQADALATKTVIKVVASDNNQNEVSVDDASSVTVHKQDFTAAFPAVDGGMRMQSARGLSVDWKNRRAFVADYVGTEPVGQQGRVIAIDMETGVRTVFSGQGQPNSDVPLRHALGLVVNEERGEIVFGGAHIYGIDMKSGARRMITAVDDMDPRYSQPTGVTVDPNDPNFVYIVDLNEDHFTRLNLISGEREIVSENTGEFSGSDVDIDYPQDLVIDEETNRALVTNRYTRSIVSVDLGTGIRTNMPLPELGGSFIPFSIAHGNVDGDVFVYERLLGVVRVTIATGERTLMVSVGDEELGSFGHVEYQPNSPYLLLLHRETNALYAFDIGSSTLLTISKAAE